MPSPEHEKLIEEHRRQLAEAERLCAWVKQQIEHLEWLVDSVRREWQPDYFQPLQAAIRAMHGYEARHLASFAVRKVRNGRVVWNGIVEEFWLVGLVGASCYAWSYAEGGKGRTFTLLKQGPVDSPQAAVQLFLLAKEGPPALCLPTGEKSP